MKKFLGVLFVLGLIFSGAYLPSRVEAQITTDTGCLPGYKYSNTTGKSCFGSGNSVCTVLDKNLKMGSIDATILQDYLFA